MEEEKGVRRSIGETEEEQHEEEEDVGVSRQRSSSRGQWCCCPPEAVISLQHIHDGASGRSQQLAHREERGVTAPPIMGRYAGVLHTQVLEKEKGVRWKRREKEGLVSVYMVSVAVMTS